MSNEFIISHAIGDHEGGSKFYELVLIVPLSANGASQFGDAVCIQRNGPMRLKSYPNAGQRRVLATGVQAPGVHERKVEEKGQGGYTFNIKVRKCATDEIRMLLISQGHPELAGKIAGNKESCRYEPPESRETVKQAEDIARIVPHNYGGW